MTRRKCALGCGCAAFLVVGAFLLFAVGHLGDPRMHYRSAGVAAGRSEGMILYDVPNHDGLRVRAGALFFGGSVRLSLDIRNDQGDPLTLDARGVSVRNSEGTELRSASSSSIASSAPVGLRQGEECHWSAEFWNAGGLSRMKHLELTHGGLSRGGRHLHLWVPFDETLPGLR